MGECVSADVLIVDYSRRTDSSASLGNRREILLWRLPLNDYAMPEDST